MGRSTDFAVGFAAMLLGCSASAQEEGTRLGAADLGTGGGGETNGPVGINPQPQPNPSELPGWTPSLVTVRSASPERLHWTGGRGSTQGKSVRVANIVLPSPSAVVADVAADGSFELEVSGSVADRFVVQVLSPRVSGSLTQIEVRGGSLTLSAECLGSLGPSAEGPSNATITLTNRCDRDVNAMVSVTARSTIPVTIPQGATVDVPFVLTEPSRDTLVVVVRDSARGARLGAFLDPTY